MEITSIFKVMDEILRIFPKLLKASFISPFTYSVIEETIDEIRLSEKYKTPEINLHGANLESAVLKGVNFKCADLSNANLKNANLDGADLSQANLSRANLNGASLRGTNLNMAVLIGANLESADLEGAYLAGSKFKDSSEDESMEAKDVR